MQTSTCICMHSLVISRFGRAAVPERSAKSRVGASEKFKDLGDGSGWSSVLAFLTTFPGVVVDTVAFFGHDG